MNTIQVHKDGKTTLVMVMIPTGAYYEDNRVKGISHFIEHICFKGTKTRSRKEIELSIERYGGVINAFTDWEVTCYWARIANQYKEIAIDVIQDLAMNPIFPTKEIEKEREVILQELHRDNDNLSNSVYQFANEIYYPKENGFHFSILGTEKSLQQINKNEIIKYYKNNYKMATLIIVGDVDNSKSITEHHVYGCPSLYYNKIKGNNKQLKQRKDIAQSNVLITNDVFLSEFSKLETQYFVDLLTEIYGGMSGRLFSKIREDHSLVYEILFSANIFSNGIIKWAVDLGLDKNKINKAYDLIIKELTSPITQKELDLAITKAIGSQALRTESISYLAEQIAYAIRSNVDWKNYLFNYDKFIKRFNNKTQINKFLCQMKFQKNILVGIVPKTRS